MADAQQFVPPGDPIASAEEQFARYELVGRAFSPSAPITDQDLFAGRNEQMTRLINIAAQRGQHALVYGERGVGKTSLARVMSSILGSRNLVAYHTCSSGDTFGSVCRDLLDEITFSTSRPGIGFGGEERQTIHTAAETLRTTEPLPNDVRRALAILSEIAPLVLFIDEFDQPEDNESRNLFADTIKIVSDHGINATLVLVGVGETVEELIAEHESVVRSLVQVNMPRMNDDEMAEIIERGARTAKVVVADEVALGITKLSMGLPHYTHLLAQHAARVALEEWRTSVVSSDLDGSLPRAIEGVAQSIRRRYHQATYSNRETIYEQVLLACALAERDEMGMFASAEVRDKLRKITQRPYDIPAFANHLNDFSSSDGNRGGVLQKHGTSRRFRYRFIDPLMPPFVLMRGISEGVIRTADL